MDAAAPGPFVEADLGGYLKPTFSGRYVLHLDPHTGQPTGVTSAAVASGDAGPKRVRIYDARGLQERAESSAAFFREHGFALLRHATAVRDWNTDYTRPRAGNDVAGIYAKEVEELIRTALLPGEDVEIQAPPAVMRRGPSQATNKNYGFGVHQDFGLGAADFEANTECYGGHEAAQQFHDKFWDPQVRGHMMINFWRPCNMKGPVRGTPLAVCSAGSVRMNDLVIGGLTGFSAFGKDKVSSQLFCKYSAEHRWYYYPSMTPDEVLVIRQFEDFKDVPKVFNTALHCAFREPGAPEDAEPRENSEYRVSVYFRSRRSRL